MRLTIRLFAEILTVWWYWISHTLPGLKGLEEIFYHSFLTKSSKGLFILLRVLVETTVCPVLPVLLWVYRVFLVNIHSVILSCFLYFSSSSPHNKSPRSTSSWRIKLSAAWRWPPHLHLWVICCWTDSLSSPLQGPLGPSGAPGFPGSPGAKVKSHSYRNPSSPPPLSAPRRWNREKIFVFSCVCLYVCLWWQVQ